MWVLGADLILWKNIAVHALYFMCMNALPACMHVRLSHAHGSQKVVAPLELELSVLVNCYVGAVN